MESFKDLVIWQRSMALVEDCYRLTSSLPRDEQFGLVSQIRRAAVSVPANISEGHGPETTAVFIQFLRIAQGSLKELETHLILVDRLKLSEAEASTRLQLECNEIGRMLKSLIRTLQAKLGEDA